MVSASAGTGKTTRLTREVSESLVGSGSGPIALEGLVAVTYTTKAQAELESRLRRALVVRGQTDRAEALPQAYLGTVHSVCLRLLKEFALDAGLSPAVDGLPQEAARHLLQEALERELDPELRRRLETTARALELREDHRTQYCDWITPVEQIMTLARNNRMNPNELPDMAARSVRGILALLPHPAKDATALEHQLLEQIQIAIQRIDSSAKLTSGTRDVLRALRESAHQLRVGNLPWSQWCKLTKLKPSRDAVPLVVDVQSAAARYEAHPRFHAQTSELCELAFEAARIGLAAYAGWKAHRGLVDYVDMIDGALSALGVREVEDELAQRLELLVVDEFQDTSPVQLALFARLHSLCKRSLWVGDRKQCIFEYAGADPELMDAVSQWVTEEGGSTEVLDQNFRSRPELVQATSLLFSRAFQSHGIRSHEVACEAHREALPALAALPPFGVWRLRTKRHAELDAVAEGVRHMLIAPAATPVLDRRTGRVRALQPGDIAVLVATNREAESLADALHSLGVASALARTGLMATPEGTLLSRALAFLVDGSDTLAAAEIELLTGLDGQEREAWLGDRIRAHSAGERPKQCAATQKLEALRSLATGLAPREVVDRLLAVLDLPRLARRWPDATQRLANLDALRSLAVSYENRCTYLREAASLAGLLRYLAEAEVPVRQADEERASDEQYVLRSENSVTIVTYHKAKGLEWPVVVLASLERERRRDPFDVCSETDCSTFDPADPLGKRWIRYWPWPLGKQVDAPLRDRAEASETGKRVALREARERARLLYVGFTRARDHLVLAIPVNAKGEPRTAWLDELSDERGATISLPEGDSEHPVLRLRAAADVLHLAARLWTLAGSREDDAVPEGASPATTPEPPRVWFDRGAQTSVEVPYPIHPSNMTDNALSLLEARTAAVERFAQRMPFARPTTATWDQIGSALHSFLAADPFDGSGSARTDLAGKILAREGLEGAFQAVDLVSASNALRAFVSRRWPDARWHREVPICARIKSPSGARCIQGVIDLLLETPQGVVVVDHKSYPGRADQWRDQALSYAPQLQVYELALQTTGHTVLGRWVHFTVGGGAVEVTDA